MLVIHALLASTLLAGLAILAACAPAAQPTPTAAAKPTAPAKPVASPVPAKPPASPKPAASPAPAKPAASPASAKPAGATAELSGQFASNLSTVEELDDIALQLRRIPGITSVSGDENFIRISYDPSQITPDRIRQALAELRHPIRP